MGTIIPNMGTKKTNITNVLFPRIRQRVLGLLFTQPTLDFYTNEIIALVNSGKGAVQRELGSLASAGLIIVKQVGNQKHYQANQNAPFFAELRSIVLKTFGLADVLREAFKPITNQLYIAFIYGSIAKQEDTTKSDIDLMMVSDKLTYVDVFPLLEKTQAQLNRKINPTIYTTSEWARKSNENNHFVKNVLVQPKIFVIGTENELNQLGEFNKN